MLRRFSGLCLALLLISSSVPSLVPASAYAQDASPVAVEDASAPSEDQEEVVDAVQPAEEAGNTPQSASPITVFVRNDVYVTFAMVSTAGNTTAFDVALIDDFPLPARFRSDNARIIEITTTAFFQFNVLVCMIYDPAGFDDPTNIELLWFDDETWTVITDPGYSSVGSATVCGYASDLGTFAVAELGSNPTAIPEATEPTTAVPTETLTETPTHTPTETPLPTDTPTPSMTASTTPTDTATASVTNSPTLPPTETATDVPTVVPSDTPIPTNTPTTTSSPPASSTSTPSATLIPTETPSETGTPTPLPTDTPSATATMTSTATPSPTPIPSHTATQQPTETPSATATETPSPTPSETPTLTTTPTAATGQTQFALPNVWVIYSEPPSSGTTHGTVLDGNTLPAIPNGHRAETAWFFSVSTTVSLTTSKQLCVLFSASNFVDPASTTLFRRQGAAWTPLSGQILDDLDSTQGTICGYTLSLGDFALAERLPATMTPTASPTATATSSRTPSNTATASPTATSTATMAPSATPSPSATATMTNSPTRTTTPTPSPTVTPSSTATPTSSPTTTASNTPSSTPTTTPTSTATPSPSSTATNSPSSTPSSTSTATLEPGSYRTGTALRTTTRVNLRAAATTNSASRGVVAKGALVTVTGASIFSGGRYWVPISTTDIGSGWIAGDYLISVATPAPTTVSTPPTSTSTPSGQQPTRTATRSPGGFIAGDFVRTTTRLNLRSSAGTSSQVLTVLPANATGQVTGAGISSGGNMFYPVLFEGHPAGFVAGKYLRRIAELPTAAPTFSPSPTIAAPIRFTTATVNMRSGPGTGYRVIATLPEDTRVSLIGAPKRSGKYDWYPVAVYGSGSGWVAGKFLSVSGPI